MYEIVFSFGYTAYLIFKSHQMTVCENTVKSVGERKSGIPFQLSGASVH